MGVHNLGADVLVLELLQLKRRILKSKQVLEQHKAKNKQRKGWGFAATTKMMPSIYLWKSLQQSKSGIIQGYYCILPKNPTVLFFEPAESINVTT